MIPPDSLVQLRQRLDRLPPKSPERAAHVAAVARMYGVSSSTVYRALQALLKPRAVHRTDRGTPRVLPQAELERYCELIAALKLRTINKQGRHLSTPRAIEILEQYGVETPQGLLRAPQGVLHKTTVNSYLRQWHLDHPRLTRQPPAVRFEAAHSNDCWQCDMSPSDLKHLETPSWIDPSKGEPTFMLFSVIDDRSGVSYMEYRCVYGEDAESALQFLFHAMAPKADPAFPFQGRPALIYLDNGPVSKSRVFQTVMQALGIAWQTHMPAGKDGTRVTARSKGKVERPFRTVKEAHETLYHFHKPETEAQANTWLLRYLMRYNDQQHRSQPHARLEDWLAHLPAEGLREMCTWEQFCRLAREPERRKVGVDARVTIAGTAYEVDPQLAGEMVLLLWGLFDDALYVEYEGMRSGPYFPVSGPIPLHRYRAFKRGKREERADRIRQVADQLMLPLAALAGDDLRLQPPTTPPALPTQPFDADALEYHFPTTVVAKLAIAEELGRPLMQLTPEDRAFIDHVLGEMRMRRLVLGRIRDYFRAKPSEQTMRVNVMQHYGFTQPLNHAGYYETQHHRQLMTDIKSAILEGHLIALCGVIGSGKTVTLRRLQQQLKDDNRVLVAKSLAVDKHRITLGTLITALFYDLSSEKPIRIPTQSEKRERELRDLVKKGKRPVVLFIDEAHALTRHTLTDLKRLLEVVEDGDGTLSIVLAGHPKLGNDLRRPTMEEIGYRTDVFTLDGIAGSQREYLQWLLHVCTAGKIEPAMLLTPDAIDLLASKLRTPLQMQRHLTLALEVGYQTGEQPISAGMVDTVLCQQFDDLEPTLTRHGYHITDLVQQFDAKPTEIKALFNNQLDPARTAALRDRMLRAGLPL